MSVFRSPRDINFDSCVRGYEDMNISDLQSMPRSKSEAVEIGTEYYFTGFCERGHLAVRSVKFNRCVRCQEQDRKKYYEENREDIIASTVEYLNNRYKTDHSFKVKKVIRSQVLRLVTSAKLSKTTNTEDLLGYTSEEFKSNIESKFYEGMNWDNYGAVWEIDHITPVGMFDIKDIGQIKEVNALENLMPMYKDAHLDKTKIDLPRILKFQADLVKVDKK